MQRQIARVLVVAMGLGAAWQATVAIAAPFSLPLPFRRVEADPQKNYELKESDGPWMIVAATFFGEPGERQAHALVLELRQQLKVPAYVYKKRFDYSEPVIGLGVDKYGQPKRMKHVHSAEFDEVAVLVGDFDSVEDPNLEKVLEKIKYAKPEALKPAADRPTAQRLAVWREIQRRLSPDQEMKSKGPMRNAFATPNPLLPKEYFAPQGPDQLVLDINKGIKHSLLDCPGKYSVRVASFHGKSTWNLHEIEESEKFDKASGKLDEAAEKSHRLTVELRKRGVEAYEFHDRHESIVTVGSFDSIGEPRDDGKIEINPAVHRIIESYGAQQTNLPGISGALAPHRLAGISFDAQPLPVEVPRASVATDYARERRGYR